MNAEIETLKRQAISKLKAGIREECADDITEVLMNLSEGTCDYLELIPVLKEVAAMDKFYYFDDNGAGGFPRADMSRLSSFKSWALNVISNIKENAKLETNAPEGQALKSNSTELIATTLGKMKAKRNAYDISLLPILEKIARKNEYKKYSYLSGFENDCQLGELAQEVIDIIKANSRPRSGQKDSIPVKDYDYVRCAMCHSLPDEITVSTRTNESFPNAFASLEGMDGHHKPEIYRCPNCFTYYHWIDMQYYSSTDNGEERLTRINPERSKLLNKLFTSPPTYRPSPKEVTEFTKRLPTELLIQVLNFRKSNTPDTPSIFLPGLLDLLWHSEDAILWGYLRDYVGNNPNHAKEVLDVFKAGNEQVSSRLGQILYLCLRLIDEKK
jgi:hypothetical protein